ncbi:hypothetical protein GCM10011343_15840 [Flavobacterium orientale]|uniref:Uncharacterized protein n=1 Tax=Flavobacterium orientale TaxID=1756020 RepID=A0A916Y1J8_9FLAO|nr:hypothetical protein GCM10011343_15840 [Flavobacterium orientale]
MTIGGHLIDIHKVEVLKKIKYDAYKYECINKIRSHFYVIVPIIR